MNGNFKLYTFLSIIIVTLFLSGSFTPLMHNVGSYGHSAMTTQKEGTNSQPLLKIPMSPATYPVAFTESGLPTGSSWWVILGGSEMTSTSSTITFQVPDGTYSYTVDDSPPSGVQFTVSPSTGSVTVGGFAPPATYVFYTVNFYLTVNAQPSSFGLVSPSSGWYMAGETFTLFATPNFGYSFSSWTGSGSGSYSGTSSSPTITLNGPITETANFDQQYYPVTFSESGLPSGTTWWVTMDGLNLSSSSTNIVFILPDGTYAYQVMDTTSNGIQYQTTSSGSVTVSGYSMVQYIFYTTNYYLTINTSPSNGGSVSPGSGWYMAGDIEFLSALPSSGYVLSSWSGSGSGSYTGSSSIPSIIMNGPITETAYFNQPNYGLTFQESGLPAGKTWWVNVGGHNMSSTSSSISFSLPDGTYSYTLMDQEGGWAKYSPGISYGTVTVFGSGYTQYVNYITSFYVGVFATPASDGTVSPSSGWVYAGNYLFLTEFPNSGYAFSSWSGNGTGSYTGSDSSPSLQVNGPLNETAHFYIPRCEVSFTESGLPAGTSWWVNLGGTNSSSTATSINVKVPDGTYYYTIGQETPPGAMYIPGYSTGEITVFGSNVSQSVIYTVQYYLNVTTSPIAGGKASALPAGTIPVHIFP